MKKFAWFLVVLIACLSLSQLMIKDSGYVLIAFNNFSYESSLWAFLLLVASAIFVLFLFWFAFLLIASAIGLIYPVTSKGRIKRARRLMVLGINYLINGKWNKAQYRLAQAADAGEAPLLNYLAAAKAAQEIGDSEKAREYLKKADRSTPNAGLAIGIADAQLLLAQNKLEQALAILKELHGRAPKHSYILKLLHKVYIKLADWNELVDLLPKLKRYKVLDEKAIAKLHTRVYSEVLNQAYSSARYLEGKEQKLKPIKKIWRDLSSSQQRDPQLIYAYASCLQKLFCTQEAEEILRNSLKRGDYSAELVKLYGLLESDEIDRQLLFLEDLLKKRPNDPVLLMALGHLSLRSKLWPKAKEYFMASIEQQPCVEAYNELGRLLAYLGEHERSTEFFRLGLRIAGDKYQDILMSSNEDSTPQLH